MYYLGTVEGDVSCTSGLVGSEPLVANLAPEKYSKLRPPTFLML